jgi:molybdenum cofactor cytidylyltransferase
MNLVEALRLGKQPVLAAVGAGGKTTFLFRLARSMKPPIIITTTTHLRMDQAQLADRHLIINKANDLVSINLDPAEILSITGPQVGDRLTGLSPDSLDTLQGICSQNYLPLLIEADGSRQLPLKAPGSHEPVIPSFVTDTVVCAGMSAIGQPLSSARVHRPDIYSKLADCSPGAEISVDIASRVLLHPLGGLKGIPSTSRRVALLNQVDSSNRLDLSTSLAELLAPGFHSVISASLALDRVQPSAEPLIHFVREATACIILAAGEGRRFGSTKQLLEWENEPLLRHVTKVALEAGCDPVVVVLGHEASSVRMCISDLPVRIQVNEAWRKGQGTSISCGVTALPPEVGSALFLMADQPNVPSTLLKALIDFHARSLHPIIIPRIRNDRVNPVIFDRQTFADLIALTGDDRGRTLFPKYPPFDMIWEGIDPRLDIDTPEDYQRLLGAA